jgi:succinyl-CoA synthetase beta subunit
MDRQGAGPCRRAGKAGGVKLCNSEHEIQDATNGMFGRKLVTHQTGPEGKGIYRVYVEAAFGLQPRDLSGLRPGPHLPAGDDRGLRRRRHGDRGNLGPPPRQHRAPSTVEPAVGLQEFQAREIAFKLGIPNALIAQMVRTLQGCYRAFRDLDATMVEINPLVITADNRILALDAKMTFDTNALFRHPQIAELRDKSQEDPRESRPRTGGCPISA